MAREQWVQSFINVEKTNPWDREPRGRKIFLKRAEQPFLLKYCMYWSHGVNIEFKFLWKKQGGQEIQYCHQECMVALHAATEMYRTPSVVGVASACLCCRMHRSFWLSSSVLWYNKKRYMRIPEHKITFSLDETVREVESIKFLKFFSAANRAITFAVKYDMMAAFWKSCSYVRSFSHLCGLYQISKWIFSAAGLVQKQKGQISSAGPATAKRWQPS